MSFWSLRQRRTQTPTLTVPGLGRAPHVAGSLGFTEAAEVQPMGFYNFHLGDVITAGAANWALDPSHDTQLMTIWGHGVMRNPFAFAATAPQVIYSSAAAPFDAIRGVIFEGVKPEHLSPIEGGESFNG